MIKKLLLRLKKRLFGKLCGCKPKDLTSYEAPKIKKKKPN